MIEILFFLLQLTGEPTCLSLMKGLVLESNRYLRKVKEAQKTQFKLFDSIKRENKAAAVNKKYSQSQERLGLQAGKSMLRESSRYGAPTVGYRFEEPPADLDEDGTDTLNATLDSDLPEDPVVGKMQAGKISFGDVNNMNTTMDYRTLAREEGLSVNQYIERCQKCLMLAWSLGASHVGVWMGDHETIMLNIVHNMVRLFAALLHGSQGVVKELTGVDKTSLNSEKKSNKKLIKVLKLYSRMLQLLRLDYVCKHMQVVALKLAQDTVHMLITNQDLYLCETKRATFHGALVLLKYTEAELLNIYCQDVPRTPVRGTNGLSMFGYDLYEPCGKTLVKTSVIVEERTAENSGTFVEEGGSSQQRGSAEGLERGVDVSHSEFSSAQKSVQRYAVGSELQGYKR